MVIMKKGQAAIEFLISYGWVIFLLILGAASLLLFFEFDREMFVREECVIIPGLNCGDIRINEDSMSLTVVNDAGWDYSSMQITHSRCNIPSYDEYFEVGDYVTFTLSDCDFDTGELFEENDVFVTYTFGESTVTHTKSANVVSVVEGGTTQGYSGDGSSGGSPGGNWSGGGDDGNYDPNADGATLLLCDFDTGFDCVGGNPLVETNVTLVNGVNGQAVFIEKNTNLIANGDFEGNLPTYWVPYDGQNNLSVNISNKFSYRGSKSAVTSRSGGLLYPGVCDEATCSYTGSCTWNSTNNQCSYGGACIVNCGTPLHFCGMSPDVYDIGKTLCWGNSNRVMYGGIRYGFYGGNLELYENINIVPNNNYSLSFMYKGSFPQILTVQTCAALGWCPMGNGWPGITLLSIPLGNYLTWQYYSDDFEYDTSFSTVCGGNSCLKELGIGKFNYGTTQANGDTFYLDNVQLEEGIISSPFAGNGGDVLKYPADSTTLNLSVGTAEMWIYVNDNIRDTQENRYLFAHKGTCGSGCYSNRISLSHDMSGVWLFAISDSTGYGNNHAISITDNLIDGWHHFAVTWNKYSESGYIEMFIDGISVKKKTNMVNYFPDNHEDGIYVGSWSSNYGRIDTVMDEFRISDTVRYT
jgi:hypothetical protein